ncbi:unnamed protein product, partial [Allacma fusca]
ILREIFRNLIYEDLVTCCNVNSIWKAVAGPMICFYRITFDSISRLDEEKLNVEVVEILGLDSFAWTRRMDFSDLMERLRNCPKRQWMSIELRLCGILTKYYLPLLTEFGDKVHVFDCESGERSFHVVSFFANIHYFSNLQVLKCNGVRLTCAYFPENELVLPNLRRIYMGKTVPIQDWPDLLKIAPNVQELYEFPVKIICFQRNIKIEAIKSLNYAQQHQNFLSKLELHQLDISMQELAEEASGLKLTSVAIPNFYYLFPRKLWDRSKPEIATIRKNFNWILKLTKDTIKVMTIPAARGLIYFLPLSFQMKSVKILKFEDDSVLSDNIGQNCFRNESPYHSMSITNWAGKHHYCPKRTVLTSMFPNLEGLEIKFNLMKSRFIEFFPRDTFGPKVLGTHISVLKIKGASPECFKKLVKLFPYVTHFEMESTLQHFVLVFPIISEAWAQLESLTVLFDPTKSFHCHKTFECFSLDPVLTGIPAEFCKEMNLHIGKTLRKDFEDKINRFQAEKRTILNLKNLKTLEFIITGKNLVCECNYTHKPNFLSEVSVNYAFKKLTDLTVFVTTILGFNAFEELKSALNPVLSYVELDNKYTVPRKYD